MNKHTLPEPKRSSTSSGSNPSFGTILINSSGNFTVTGMGFQPAHIKFEAAIPVDSTDTEFSGSGNSNTEDNFEGVMVGFSTPNKEQFVSSGGSGNSINAVRAFSKSDHCVGVSYGDQNGNEIAEITATISSFDSDGFTLNCDTYSSVGNVSGLLVIYTAWE